MVDIPEDVKTAAYEAMKTVDDLGAMGVIARAILAERQRCADVARAATVRYEVDFTEMVDKPILHRDLIAAAIMSGEK